MNRVLVTIGPVTIYWYSFLILLAVLIGYEIVIKYAKKIEEILSDEKKLKEVSEKAYEDLFITWDDEVERIYKEYLRLIESRKV